MSASGPDIGGIRVALLSASTPTPCDRRTICEVAHHLRETMMLDQHVAARPGPRRARRRARSACVRDIRSSSSSEAPIGAPSRRLPRLAVRRVITPRRGGRLRADGNRARSVPDRPSSSPSGDVLGKVSDSPHVAPTPRAARIFLMSSASLVSTVSPDCTTRPR